MNYLDFSEKLDRLKYSIESNTCVTVTALSDKLEVSQRTIYRMIRILKIKGIDIQYHRRKQAYFIREDP